MEKISKKPLYRITFLNQGKVYELYAKAVGHGHLGGFVEISGITFGEHSTLVLDPSEEKLKSEFADVERFHVPFHSVIRVDEVSKRGTCKITDADPNTNITRFPLSPNGDHKAS